MSMDHAELTTEEVLRRDIPWETYITTKLISRTGLQLLRQYDNKSESQCTALLDDDIVAEIHQKSHQHTIHYPRSRSASFVGIEVLSPRLHLRNPLVLHAIEPIIFSSKTSSKTNLTPSLCLPPHWMRTRITLSGSNFLCEYAQLVGKGRSGRKGGFSQELPQSHLL